MLKIYLLHGNTLKITATNESVCTCVCVAKNTKPAIEPCTFVKDTKPVIDWLWFVLQKIDSFFI